MKIIDLTLRKKISIIIPLYNEQEAIEMFYLTLSKSLQKILDYDFEILFVNDGSTDQTIEKLKDLIQSDSRVIALELSRNFGKEIALTAGLDAASGDAAIPIDADLQDPPELISRLIAEWEKGFEVVLAQRADRSSDSVLKRKTAQLFYKIHNWVSQVKIPVNVGDFRLLDRKVLEALKQLPEQHRFMKGLFSWVGFRTTLVQYQRQPRAAGTSKFTGWRLWNFALEGITSFSISPLRFWTYLGIIGALISIIYSVIIIIRTILFGADVPGYPSLFVAISFFGSLQLIGIGMLGEYVGRIYMESKRRPLYFIRERHQNNKE
jgi:glycosyltransferase involved in cell wall biosynthesis